MPANQAVRFRQRDFDQAAAARPAAALSGIGCVGRAVAGAEQPLAAVVENAVGLPVKRHRHVRAPVEVGVCHSPVSNGEGAAGLAGVIDVKSNGRPAIGQLRAIAKRLQRIHRKASRLIRWQ